MVEKARNNRWDTQRMEKMHFFFKIQLKPFRQPVRPICGLMLFYGSICRILYIVGPYRASVAARTIVQIKTLEY